MVIACENIQGFRNSGDGWGVAKLPWLGESEILLGRNFFTGWWECEEDLFLQFKLFLELKTPFYEYWTSVKIKISMTCVSKDYEIKTKIVQEQWLQLKKTFLLGYNLKIFI